jgi:cytochrome c556
MKRCITPLIVAAAVLIALLVGPIHAQPKKPSEPDKSSVWMKMKLTATQNIIAGLTEADFEKVRVSAESMSFLGYLESWTRSNTPEYKRQVTYFDFANSELIRQAREKNLDGATLAYNQLSISCVQCHKIVRDASK